MTDIPNLIAEIESQGPKGQISYRAAAKKYGVDATTLARRHHGQTQSRAAAAQQRQLLTPPQEAELVKYIQRLSERSLPPTRAMIRKYVAAIAQWEPSQSWVSRFLRRHSLSITNKTATSIDRDRHKADCIESYRSYFHLLHDKLEKYDVAPHNIYNMDEKGFLLGKTSRSKRIFSKPAWEQKKVRAVIQDGSREWITVIACICADGRSVDPVIVYEASGGLRDGWLQQLEEAQH
jgi:transposase